MRSTGRGLMSLESIPLPVWAIVIVVVMLAFGVPVRCGHQTSKPPFRGCKARVVGFLGKCGHHGRVPGARCPRDGGAGGQRVDAAAHV